MGGCGECLENILRRRWWCGSESSALGFSSALVCLLICGMFFCSGHEELESTSPPLLCPGPDSYHQKGLEAWLLRRSKSLAYKGPFK